MWKKMHVLHGRKRFCSNVNEIVDFLCIFTIAVTLCIDSILELVTTTHAMHTTTTILSEIELEITKKLSTIANRIQTDSLHDHPFTIQHFKNSKSGLTGKLDPTHTQTQSLASCCWHEHICTALPRLYIQQQTSVQIKTLLNVLITTLQFEYSVIHKITVDWSHLTIPKKSCF